MRLAGFVVASGVLSWLLRAHHVAGEEELYRFLTRLGFTMVLGGFVWMAYLALEPLMRRLWPQMLVSWVRVLDGRFRDPLVGRDVVAGVLAGFFWVVLSRGLILAPAWFGLPSLRPDRLGPPFEMAILSGLLPALGFVAALLRDAVTLPLQLIVLLLLSHIALRRTWLAIAAFLVIFAASAPLSAGDARVDYVAALLVGSGYLVLLFRWGLLTLIVSEFVATLVAVFPQTFDTSAWYAGTTLIALLAVGALTAYGLRTALRTPRPLPRTA
jgi:hypothetical protein